MITKESKNIAIISYLTVVGSIIALFMNSENKTAFASFHIRQALGLFLSYFAFAYLIGYFDSWMISGSFFMAYFILWIFGFLGALQNEQREIPIVGAFFQSFFKNL